MFLGTGDVIFGRGGGVGGVNNRALKITEKNNRALGLYEKN